MPKDERNLQIGAELHWPGSGAHLLAIYACLKKAERMGWLWAGATITDLLRIPDERTDTLRCLRERVQAKGKATRQGPKYARYHAAVLAIDALEALHAGGQS